MELPPFAYNPVIKQTDAHCPYTFSDLDYELHVWDYTLNPRVLSFCWFITCTIKTQTIQTVFFIYTSLLDTKHRTSYPFQRIFKHFIDTSDHFLLSTELDLILW
jgi:hypothetical protein